MCADCGVEPALSVELAKVCWVTSGVDSTALACVVAATSSLPDPASLDRFEDEVGCSMLSLAVDAGGSRLAGMAVDSGRGAVGVSLLSVGSEAFGAISCVSYVVGKLV